MLNTSMVRSVERGGRIGPLLITGFIQRMVKCRVFDVDRVAYETFYENRRTVSYRLGRVTIVYEVFPSVASIRKLCPDHKAVSFRFQFLVPYWIAKRLTSGIPFWSFRLEFKVSV